MDTLMPPFETCRPRAGAQVANCPFEREKTKVIGIRGPVGRVIAAIVAWATIRIYQYSMLSISNPLFVLPLQEDV